MHTRDARKQLALKAKGRTGRTYGSTPGSGKCPHVGIGGGARCVEGSSLMRIPVGFLVSFLESNACGPQPVLCSRRSGRAPCANSSQGKMSSRPSRLTMMGGGSKGQGAGFHWSHPCALLKKWNARVWRRRYLKEQDATRRDYQSAIPSSGTGLLRENPISCRLRPIFPTRNVSERYVVFQHEVRHLSGILRMMFGITRNTDIRFASSYGRTPRSLSFAVTPTIPRD